MHLQNKQKMTWRSSGCSWLVFFWPVRKWRHMRIYSNLIPVPLPPGICGKHVWNRCLRTLYIWHLNSRYTAYWLVCSDFTYRFVLVVVSLCRSLAILLLFALAAFTYTFLPFTRKNMRPLLFDGCFEIAFFVLLLLLWSFINAIICFCF